MFILDFCNQVVENSNYLLTFSLVILLISSYGGKFLSQKRRYNEAIADNETSIVIGAILSFLALLIGFVMSTAITGYNARQATEEKEAISIGVAIHAIQLMQGADEEKAQSLLQNYLTHRIDFFNTDSQAQVENSALSFQIQQEMWNNLLNHQQQIAPVYYSKLVDIYMNLYQSQLQTEASWKYQIPRAAWILLFIFAMIACILIGYNLRGVKGKNALLIFVPLLISLSFYIVAEIDSPTEGFIEVEPDNLIVLQKRYFSLLS